MDNTTLCVQAQGKKKKEEGGLACIHKSSRYMGLRLLPHEGNRTLRAEIEELQQPSGRVLTGKLAECFIRPGKLNS